MKKLFAQEVPEIYDGIIEIKAAARDPGSRAKIGVISHDSSIDPVGACVGMKGSRVQAVVQELQGEKIDIIPGSEDLATFVVNALQPATVSRVVIDEEESRIEVVVPDDQLSLAIGRRGQNVRLASQLTSSQIDILTEADASEKRQREFVERSSLFQNELDVDETLSQLLVAEGFTSLEEVAYVQRRRDRLDRGPRRRHRVRAPEPRRGSARAPRSRLARGAPQARRRGRARRDPAPHRADAGDARQGQHPHPRRPRRPRHRRAHPEEAGRAAPPARPSNRPEDKGGILGDTASAKSRATRSSWPPAPIGSRTRTPAQAEEAADAESPE